MTEDKWKEIENNLLIFYRPVNLMIDDYEIKLIPTMENMKLYIVIFVNDKFKWEWVKEDCDIRQRFMCPSKHCLLKQKELNKITRSKRKQKELKDKHTYTSFSPYWSSFKRLRSHLVKNNQNIEYPDKDYL